MGAKIYLFWLTVPSFDGWARHGRVHERESVGGTSHHLHHSQSDTVNQAPANQTQPIRHQSTRHQIRPNLLDPANQIAANHKTVNHTQPIRQQPTRLQSVICKGPAFRTYCTR